jgi:hypothetical protein
MILTFSKVLQNKNTYFVEKILNSFDKSYYIDISNHWNTDKGVKILNGQCFDDYYKGVEIFKPKFHTIREDKSNRWKFNNTIDFFIDSRTKNM